MPQSPGDESLVRAVAAFGLDRDSSATRPMVFLDADWGRSLSRLKYQRLTGLAVAALDMGALSLSSEQEGDLIRAQRDAMIRALHLERRLLELASAFEEVGIDFVVLKGPAVAYSCYPDSSWRPFGDLDILVRLRDFTAACGVLARLAYRRRFAEPRPGFVERFGHTAVHVGQDDVEVDLHRTLIAGPFGQWIQADELFDVTERFVLAGRNLPRLSNSALVLHASVHASLGSRPPLFLPLRDVVQSARSSGVDWEFVTDLAERWKLRAVMAHAFGTASRELCVDLPEAAFALARIPFSRRERRALEAYTTGRRDRGGRALETLWAIHGLRGKVAYARALLFPDREFLTARTGVTRKTANLRRWRVPLRWLTARLRRT